jgi:urease alpha subunit
VATPCASLTPTSDEVERDDCIGGDEAVFGGGKIIRESMAQG